MGIWILDQLIIDHCRMLVQYHVQWTIFLSHLQTKINFHIFRPIEQKIAWTFIMSSTFRLNTPRPMTMILRNKRFDKLNRENNLMAICRICWLTQEKKKKCSQEFYIWKRKKKISCLALSCLGKGYKKTHKQVYFYLTSQITNIKNIYIHWTIFEINWIKCIFIRNHKNTCWVG